MSCKPSAALAIANLPTFRQRWNVEATLPCDKSILVETPKNRAHFRRETTNQSPVPLLHRAILLASPSVKVLNMRKSMKSVPTPRALSERQRTHQAIAWILKAAEKGRRAGARRDERIAREILAILEGTSEVFKWLETRHKDATLARSVG